MTTASMQPVPDCKQDFTHLWIMYYRHGMNANLTKGFYHEGDVESAVKRARRHCEIMGYKYIFVRPMVCNIKADEEYKLGGGGDLTP